MNYLPIALSLCIMPALAQDRLQDLHFQRKTKEAAAKAQIDQWYIKELSTLAPTDPKARQPLTSTLLASKIWTYTSGRQCEIRFAGSTCEYTGVGQKFSGKADLSSARLEVTAGGQAIITSTHGSKIILSLNLKTHEFYGKGFKGEDVTMN